MIARRRQGSTCASAFRVSSSPPPFPKRERKSRLFDSQENKIVPLSLGISLTPSTGGREREKKYLGKGRRSERARERSLQSAVSGGKPQVVGKLINFDK